MEAENARTFHFIRTGLMVEKPGTFNLAAPGEDEKFRSPQLRLATKALSPGRLCRKLARWESSVLKSEHQFSSWDLEQGRARHPGEVGRNGGAFPEVSGRSPREPGSPPGAEVPYCDLPRRLPVSEGPLGFSTSGCQSVVGLGLGPGPERGPSAGSSAEGPTVAPRSQGQEAVPYLEGLASSLSGSFDEGPDSGTSSSPECNTPDDPSDSSSVDWDTVERQEEAPSWDELTVMIPRKPQEGPRADSARRVPCPVTRAPAGGDTAGQRKEDTCSRSRSAGQHWAKLRGESGYFLEQHRSALTQASCATPQSGPRSATPQTSSLHRSTQRDVIQTASTQLANPRASSPPQITQRDNPRTSFTQQNTPSASSPSRLAQRDNPRASSPNRTTQRDNPRTSWLRVRPPLPHWGPGSLCASLLGGGRSASMLYSSLSKLCLVSPGGAEPREPPELPGGGEDARSTRKSEAPGAFQARDEGRSQRPSQGQSQLLRRQSSPALSREVTKPLAKQAEPARRSQAESPHPRSPERRPEGDWRLQGSSLPLRTSARTPERERRPERSLESGRAGPRQPPGGRQSQEESPGAQGPHRYLERGWGSLPELCPHQPTSPPESSRVGPEIPTTTGRGAEGTCPHRHSPERRPELDWRDLVGLLGALREGAWACMEASTLASRLPRLDWEGLLELLQARLPRQDPAGHGGTLATASGPEVGSPATNGTLERERQGQPDGWVEATLVNGQKAGPWPQSSAQPPSPDYVSTQWPKTKVTRGPETSTMASLEEMGQPGSRSPAEGPSLPQWEFQSEEPEESEPSKGRDSLTDQKQADSADKRPAEGKAGSPLKGRLVTSWRMPGDVPTLFNPFLLSLGVLRWQRCRSLLRRALGWQDAQRRTVPGGQDDSSLCFPPPQPKTKDAVYTLSAMTSGIRRNWIEALRKTVRPTSAPDVTKLSDCNKENTPHSTQKGSLKAGEQRVGSEVIGRGGPRKADGQRQSLDYVELAPLTQGSPQRARTPARALDRPAKQEELERDLAQRSEERRKWFEATDGRPVETPTGEAPRRGLGAPLTEDQQSRLSEEIEKKWQELEKLPLRENKRVPLTALLNQSRGERRGPPRDSHEALEKEVQSLRAQLEAWRLQGEAPQSAPRPQEDSHIPPGYISQEACERSLAEMESSHQQVMEELQRHHERELQRLQQEKEWLLAEETAATASAIEAMKKAYQEELSRELSKTRSLQQGPDGLRKQHQSDVAALKRELQVLSEQYSQKCLEIGALTRQAEEREHTLRRCQQEGQELLRHNQELHARLSEEIDRLRGFIASQGTSDGCGRSSERSSCELEVLLRVKENELQYLKKEVQCLRDELQMLQKDKERFTSGKYQDVYVELNHIKTRSEREIEQLKEHLRLAMAALREKESMRNSLAE
ncbi:TRIO and F-actin-binding protein [Puma concolor]|uniref:TRIO and F-actin-binding protein n=1 Tax=Puma concolor TaxID=9696 RepID=A0A6P6I543_PUMCO|nr:TRIO and F-actin-binding protein [Puma concolor]